MLAGTVLRRTVRAWSLAAPLYVLSTGCFLIGYEGVPRPADAGLPDLVPDAGVVPGEPGDAAAYDAGVPGSDAASGAPMDAGSRDDAEVPMDAAAPNDAGLPDDAQTQPELDASRSDDGGASEDWLSDAATVLPCDPVDLCSTLCANSLGECLLDCSDATTCEAQCMPETLCLVECVDSLECDLLCHQDSRCAFNCGGGPESTVSSCSSSCASGTTCRVSCAGTDSCSATCQTGSSCAIDCRGATDCNAVVCEPGAACLLYCPGEDCSWQSCSDALACPDGTFACGTACPSAAEWSWDDFSTRWGAPAR